MFPSQSLMDNITLSIDSWLAAVIIPYYPSLSICFDSDWKAKWYYADIYTQNMIGAVKQKPIAPWPLLFVAIIKALTMLEHLFLNKKVDYVYDEGFYK